MSSYRHVNVRDLAVLRLHCIRWCSIHLRVVADLTDAGIHQHWVQRVIQCVQNLWTTSIWSFLEIFRIIFGQKIEIFKIALPARTSGSFSLDNLENFDILAENYSENLQI